MSVPAVLFVLTFLTTFVSGALIGGAVRAESLADLLPAMRRLVQNPADLAVGLSFAVPLLAILGVHELGHYVAARRHRVAVTPPYFIPFLPLPPLPGTLGAIIKIRSPFPDRNALMDVGAAGPLAGAAVAIPVIVAGLAFSQVRPAADLSGIPLGESLLFRLLTRLVLGEIPEGYDVLLHPAAYAGWLGLVVTMLNLTPSGQLDGGHIAYALFGARYGEVGRLIPYALLFLGLLYQGWFVWAALIFLIGTRHPAPVFDEIPLTRGRRAAGLATAALFVLCFTPRPFLV